MEAQKQNLTETLSTDMTTKSCKCGKVKEQIINAEDKVRSGWWCRECNEFEKAIGRERKWT
jgi:hypothetical protein